MARDLFSVPIFLIVFREVTEAAIVLSVLLALVEQIVKHSPVGKHLTEHWDKSEIEHAHPHHADRHASTGKSPDEYASGEHGDTTVAEVIGLTDADRQVREKKLIRRLRIQILAGSVMGLFIAVCIGAAFLAVYYTELDDLYGSAEELWEGIFNLIAMVMIFVMGLTMLKIDRAKVKWRLKIAAAFEAHGNRAVEGADGARKDSWWRTMFSRGGGSDGRQSKYILFFLPFVTVLREGLEAVVFVGGVSLGQPATSIPIAAIVGLICGILVGVLIYGSSSRLNLSIFLVVSTAFLMLIGAGLLAKATWYFTLYPFIKAVGGDVAEAGDGPGSYPVDGVIYHLDYGNPENNLDSAGWGIFSGIFGWNNTMTYATLFVYLGYWLAVIGCLVFMKWHEGRTTIFGYASQARKDRLARRAARASAAANSDGSDRADTVEKTSSNDDDEKAVQPESPASTPGVHHLQA